MKWIFDVDASRCTACGACAIGCMDQNDIDIEGGDCPLRLVFACESDDATAYVSMACMHCENAPCVRACPTGCLSKDLETGLTVYDRDLCIGCHSCAMACPFGAPSFDKEGKMRKCDGCITRLQHGMEPACVRLCPTGALHLYKEDEYKAARIGRSLKKIITDKT